MMVAHVVQKTAAGLRLILTLAMLITMAGCVAPETQGSPPTPAPIAPPRESQHVTIWISKEGVIELNGRQAPLETVASELADLAKHEGVVLYSRDAPQEEPHQNGVKVIEMIVNNRLPIRMTTKRDFSDTPGPDGKLKQ